MGDKKETSKLTKTSFPRREKSSPTPPPKPPRVSPSKPNQGKPKDKE